MQCRNCSQSLYVRSMGVVCTGTCMIECGCYSAEIPSSFIDLHVLLSGGIKKNGEKSTIAGAVTVAHIDARL